jgi:hypothetical protein
MAKKKERPQGIEVISEEHATELARKRAHWSRIPAAYQMEQGEAADPQEKLDALNEQDKRDRKEFRLGNMEKCCFSQAIEKEAEEERRNARMQMYG